MNVRWLMSGSIACLALTGLSACSDPEEIPAEVPGIDLPSGGKEDAIAATDPASCPGGAPTLVNGYPAAWTIMHYAAADNNLESYLLRDINEMERGHNDSRQVNVLVQLDKHTEEGVWRYKIGHDSDPEALHSELVGQSDEEPDSGDWRTLAAFGEWAATCYPADGYMVIVGGHGSGWSKRQDDRAQQVRESARTAGEAMRMIAPDDSSNSEIHISELDAALKYIKAATVRPSDPPYLNRLQVYGSDACLMQTAEVLYDLRNTAQYIVGSEETEPGAGWPYNTVMRELTGNSTRYARQPHLLVDLVVNGYGTSYTLRGGAGTTDSATLSAVNTEYIIRARNRIDTIGGLLADLMAESPDLAARIHAVHRQTFFFSDSYVDLAWFLEEVRADLVADGTMPEVGDHLGDRDPRFREFREAIDDLLEDIWPYLVPEATVGASYVGARGVSIYLPKNRCGWGLDADTYKFSSLASETRWGDLVEQMLWEETSLSDSAEGHAAVELNVDPWSVSDDAFSCDIHSGRLELYGTSETYEVSLKADVSEDQIEIIGVDVKQIDGAKITDLILSEDAGDVLATDLTIAPGETFAGTFTAPLKDVGTGDAAGDLTLTFTCTGMHKKSYCW